MNALANLDLTLGFVFKEVGSAHVADTNFPTLTADFIMDWTFEPGSGLGSLTAPYVGFENIRLNLRSFLTGFVGDILDPIRAALGPVESVIDILTTPVPVLSDIGFGNYTFLDLARDFGHADVADFIEGMKRIINLVNHLEGIGADAFIDYGSLKFGGSFDLRESGKDISDLNADKLEKEEGVNLEAPFEAIESQLQQLAADFSRALEWIPGDFSFPLLEEPKTVIQLLFGRDVKLFEYKMPDLNLGFSFRSPPIYIWLVPPVYVQIGGAMGFQASFIFGYDTHGLRTFVNNPNDLSVLSDGFYFSDRIQGSSDLPEVALWGELVAGGGIGGSINIFGAKVTLAAGVEGGIFASVDLNLNDPNSDGKIRYGEFQNNVRRGAL
jgi:hypothetical protein